MESTFKKIKRWYKVTQPHKGLFFGMFLTSSLPCLISIFFTLAEAKVVTSIKALDYNMAIFWLIATFVGYFFYYFTWHLNYRCYYKSQKYMVVNMSERLYDKLERASEQGLSGQSVEKLLNIFSANITTAQRFADYLSYKISYLIQCVVTIGIVAFYNVYVALIMAALVVLMYFWYAFVCNLTERKTAQIYHSRDHVSEQLAGYIEGREYTVDLNLEEKNKEAYLASVHKTVDHYAARGHLTVLRSRWTYIVLYAIVTALTIWLATITHMGELTLTAYLVLAPYLISIIERGESGFGFLNDLQSCSVNVQRIETVLNMPEADIVAYSDNTTDDIAGSLKFNNINYIDVPEKGAKSGNLTNASFEIKPHSVVMFRGVKGCGKRTIFYLMRRVITPTTGTITMDGINIYDFDKDTYKHNFSYATSKPYFYNESVLDNLSYTTSSRKEIYDVCKRLQIDELVKALPHGYSTNMVRENEYFSPYLLFMLGLARSVLSKAEFLCIYEFPVSLTTKEQQNILKTITGLKRDHAIIIFAAGDVAKKICNQIFIVQAGKIKQVEVQ